MARSIKSDAKAKVIKMIHEQIRDHFKLSCYHALDENCASAPMQTLERVGARKLHESHNLLRHEKRSIRYHSQLKPYALQLV